MDNTTIIAIVLASFTFVGTIFKIIYPMISARFTSVQLNTIKSICEILLFAAETIYNQTGQGKTKKEYVLAILIKLFPKVDSSVLEAVLEGLGTKLGLFSSSKTK